MLFVSLKNVKGSIHKPYKVNSNVFMKSRGRTLQRMIINTPNAESETLLTLTAKNHHEKYR